MMMAEHYPFILQQAAESTFNMTPHELIQLVDYTCLNIHATTDEINRLHQKAMLHHVAAICIYPQHLSLLPKTSPVRRATVVNFPSGEASLADVIQAIEQIQHNEIIHEIDYVFPYQTYLTGHHAKALAHCKAVYDTCRQAGLTYKVILETGAFHSMDAIYELSLQVINAGCDFLKTSTGKIHTGASLPAAFAMLRAIQDTGSTCGIKFSGGIKTLDQAIEYTRLAAFMLEKEPHSSWLRLGASTLFI